MRLGVVMTGTGALAAACVGVMQELAKRGMEPFAVCGMQAGAWPASLWMAGQDECDMQIALLQTARMGKRMIHPACRLSALLDKKRRALIDSRRIEHLLIDQTQRRLLCTCKRPGIFLCRTVQTGRKVVFSSRAFEQERHTMLSMQASVSFAARAAMTRPPFIEPMQWMGSLLIEDQDVGFACRQLLTMGAQRVLVAAPVLSPRHVPDALDLAGMTDGRMSEQQLPPQAAMLSIEAPDAIGALSVDQLPAIVKAGQIAAGRQMDGLFERLGMAPCRVLPFRKPYAQTGTR